MASDPPAVTVRPAHFDWPATTVRLPPVAPLLPPLAPPGPAVVSAAIAHAAEARSGVAFPPAAASVAASAIAPRAALSLHELADRANPLLRVAMQHARTIASRAIAIARPFLPVVFAHVSRIAARVVVLHRSPDRLLAFAAARGQAVAAMASVAVALIIVLWWFAARAATREFTDTVDGFLIRHDLSQTVTYGGISATPTGRGTLRKPRWELTPAIAIGADRVELAAGGSDDDDGNIEYFVAASGIDIPLLAMVRAGRGTWPALPEAIGLGYTRCVADGEVEVRYDATEQALSVTARISVEDMGYAEGRFEVIGVKAPDGDPGVTLAPGDLASADRAVTLGVAIASAALSEARLRFARVAIDLSPLIARSASIPASPLPTDDSAGPRDAPLLAGEDIEALVRAGMRPSAAREFVDAVTDWERTGGEISVTVHLDDPAALPTGIAAFTSSNEYLTRLLAGADVSVGRDKSLRTRIQALTDRAPPRRDSRNSASKATQRAVAPTAADEMDAAIAASIAVALEAAAIARTAVAEHFAAFGTFPGSMTDAGLNPEGFPLPVRIEQQGVITISLRGPADVAGARFVMAPERTADGGVRFSCRGDGVPTQHLPKGCR